MLPLKINFKTFSLWSVSTRRWTLFLTARAKLDSVSGGCAYLSETYTTHMACDDQYSRLLKISKHQKL